MARNKKTSMTLFQFMNLLIALLMKNGQYRTMQHYKATLNSIKRYLDNKDIALNEIDAEVMRSYEAYLHHTAKVCRNTSSFYLRILRATYNKAVVKGLTPQQHPFKEVYTGIAPTRKRAIPTESVSQIKSLQSVKDLSSKEEMRLYHNAEARISYHLRKVGAKIGIKGKLTLYVARHSWATTARGKNIPISVISEALGHHSETTTQIYLNSVKSSEVDDANAKILAAL